MVVAVASGVVRMPALNTAVVDIRSNERSACFPGDSASCKLSKASATDKDGNDGRKEKPRPGDQHKRIAFEQVFHDGIKGYEAQHGGQHPEDAAHAIFVGIRRRHATFYRALRGTIPLRLGC